MFGLAFLKLMSRRRASVVAAAGRRIDAFDAMRERFPLANAARVRERIRHWLEERRPQALVSSAACGADLLVLEEAESLGIRRRIVLPFEPSRFRETSVVDRPGRWGPAFDRLLELARHKGDLVVLVLEDGTGEGATACADVNEVLFAEAERLARALDSPGSDRDPLVALIVWDGTPRGEDDITARFARAGRSRGLEISEILTR